MAQTPADIALGIVEKFSWTTNVARDGKLVGQKYVVAGAIAKAIEDDRDAHAAEVAKLRSALQRICNLPLAAKTVRKNNPNERARRIAVAALGGNPQALKHTG